jgi:hypothetical protein
MFNGRRQPSYGGTSRMMREYQVRICERLGVKLPGPTRQSATSRLIRDESVHPSISDIGRCWSRGSFGHPFSGSLPLGRTLAFGSANSFAKASIRLCSAWIS